MLYLYKYIKNSEVFAIIKVKNIVKRNTEDKQIYYRRWIKSELSFKKEYGGEIV